MAKKKTTRKTTAKKKPVKKTPPRKAVKKKTTTRTRQPKVDSADGVKVGEEPVPGMRLRCICRGHAGTIGRIAWSPCGRFIASPSSDKTIRIWDANDGKCLAVLEGHERRVNCVAWSPDSNRLASGSENGALRVWDVESRSLVWSHNLRPWIRDAAWSPDGDTLAVVGSDVLIRWSADTWHRMEDIDVRRATSLWYVEWSPTGEKITTCDASNVKVWNAVSGTQLHELEVPATHFCARWSPTGEVLASGGNGGEILIWDAESGQSRYVLEGHASNVGCIAFSHDGRLLVSTSPDGTMRLYDTRNWEPLQSVRISVAVEKDVPGAVELPGCDFRSDAPEFATVDLKRDLIFGLF